MPAKHARKAPVIPPKKGNRRGNPPTATPDYDADEFEFIKAMDKFKREKHRPFPTWSEMLGVLKKLGYRKQDRGTT